MVDLFCRVCFSKGSSHRMRHVVSCLPQHDTLCRRTPHDTLNKQVDFTQNVHRRTLHVMCELSQIIQSVFITAATSCDKHHRTASGVNEPWKGNYLHEWPFLHVRFPTPLVFYIHQIHCMLSCCALACVALQLFGNICFVCNCVVAGDGKVPSLLFSFYCPASSWLS